MRRALLPLAGCIAALCAATALASPADTALTIGTPARAVWTPGVPMTFTFALERGDFVQGSLDGPAATLTLADTQGRPVRRLLGPTSLSRDFMFVAPASGQYRFVVEAGHGDVPGAVGGQPTPGAAYALRLARVIPAAAQQAVSDVPESPAILALSRTLAAGGNTGAFWRDAAARGTPLVEPLPQRKGAEAEVLLTFVWRGAQRNVRLLGSPAGDHDALTQLAGSDVWYHSYRVPATTRMSYQLAPDVPQAGDTPQQQRRAILATIQRDPLNPNSFPAGAPDAFAQKSVVELPGAPPQPWITPRAGVPAGTVTPFTLDSRILGEPRDVYLYRPAGAKPTALLVVFDAQAYLSLVPTQTILDNLIAEGRIPPTAALVVANPSAAARGAQLPPNPKFSDFLANELMPWAERQGLPARADRTVVAGSSYGGLAAAYAGMTHPERFGLVLSQSGSYWWGPGGAPDQPPTTGGWMMREFAQRPRLPLRFYLEAGLFEQGRGPINITATTRSLRDVLVAKGYPVTHAEFASGHDYLQWRGTLACGLMVLLGKKGPADPVRQAACPVLSSDEPQS
ncbi:enterochelin esterase domain-containing protein [Cupriavidus agavae]|uniref:Enterochelin esterase family protein n=1 Tax=Cupriavidus agavae TaxID=1001822 RepID=A0A4Q7RED3_9BURK|nr:alpha/beta hydrolase-fold protein [Cupriavidus agavae]RZT30768.1 enterochelin esterase family protein [Cupriavidus agavae]